ncbi:hypothetical protein FJT64_011510 [Amphibalanus amphitrite]|uniref:SGNH hydrolase-type esterase domain-containing protein n=1 Tax=Amphibalanus amphitrite TaxID=1232801 RepID=A0A6A4VFD9_AMPAM|nr:hypothetical protein FJT64_011510 [Amphibalanus amphitrite]
MLHLLLGDSIANRAGLASRFPKDQVLNRARGGETWRSLFDRVEDDIAVWQVATTAMGKQRGEIIVWLTGNDVYSRLSRMSSFTAESLTAIGLLAEVLVKRLRSHTSSVLLLGPLPRLAGEVIGTTWEATAAYHLERTLLKAQLDPVARVLPLGRALTRKMGRKRHGLMGCNRWYQQDGIHLNRDGYEKVADAGSFPVWLTLKPEA